MPKKVYYASSIPKVCDSSTTITGKTYNVIGDNHLIYLSPSKDSEKQINKRASEALKKTTYATIDSSLQVNEACFKDGWSWIRVKDPIHFWRQGWVESSVIAKPVKGSDKYYGKFSVMATEPYERKFYPKMFSQFGARMSVINKLRIEAAKKSIDSGECDYVIMSELSDRSSLNNLHFWVDCRNKNRLRFTEENLSSLAE